MSRLLRRALVLASLALTDTAAWAQPAPVRLTAPQHGATLEAGSLAVLAWDSQDRFGALSQVEEWEAFLSLDGGAHYPVRITPHLDRDLRRVLWQVPHIPTRDARLLLRFGNEHHETAIELPQRFAITGTVSPFEPGTVSLSATPGEPARPGDAGVVAWVEGSRRGGALRQKVAAGAVGLATGRSIAPDAAWRLALESEDSVPGPLHPLAGPKVRFTPPRPAAPRSFALTAWLAPIPILLLTQRQNE